MRYLGAFLLATAWGLLTTALAFEAPSDLLRPRVPPQALATARSWQNPLPDTPEVVEQGRRLLWQRILCRLSWAGRPGDDRCGSHPRQRPAAHRFHPGGVAGRAHRRRTPVDFAAWQRRDRDGGVYPHRPHGGGGLAGHAVRARAGQTVRRVRSAAARVLCDEPWHVTTPHIEQRRSLPGIEATAARAILAALGTERSRCGWRPGWPPGLEHMQVALPQVAQFLAVYRRSKIMAMGTRKGLAEARVFAGDAPGNGEGRGRASARFDARQSVERVSESSNSKTPHTCHSVEPASKEGVHAL